MLISVDPDEFEKWQSQALVEERPMGGSSAQMRLQPGS